MSAPKLTDEQRAVVETAAKRLTVLAAAGSGKTKTLVERYLRFIVEGRLSPDQVLTVTFTRKAAAEMKQRIVGVLRDNGMPDEAQIAETGPIQTLHSFCERVLRENAFEAGVDPSFEVTTDNSTGLVDRSLKRVIQHKLDDLPHALELVRRLVGKQSWGVQWEWLSSLTADALQDVISSVRASGIDLGELERRHNTPEAVERTWREALLRRMPCEALDEYGSRSYAELTRLTKMVPKWRTSDWAKGAREHRPQDSADTCGLVQLLVAICRDMESEMIRLQSFDFCLLESLTVRLLATSEVVRERLREQHKVVLVDESQDVNPVQYRLLDSLGLEHEMMVGDPQQSIYGFRHADRELFVQRTTSSEPLRLSRNFRSAEGIQNFVDCLFSELWKDGYMPMQQALGSEDPEDPFAQAPRDFTGVEFWDVPKKDVSKVARLVAEMIQSGECSARDIALLCRLNKGCQSYADALGKLGVLTRIVGGSERFYTRLEVHDIANSLQALTDPSDDFALLAMLRSPVVGLSLDSMVMLSGEGVDGRLESTALPSEEDRGKLAQFLEWYRPLAGYAERMPAWSVIASVVNDSPLLNNLAGAPNRAQAIANVRKLLTLAVSKREMGPIAFAEHIRTIQFFQHKEGEALTIDPEADVVTLMTIHKAKGLEFPVVVLPDLNNPPPRVKKKAFAGVRDEAVATSFSKSTDRDKPPLAFSLLKKEAEMKDSHERWRVTYVAMTRAQKRLCLAMDLQAPTNNTMAAEVVERYCQAGKPASKSIVVKPLRTS